MHELFVLSFSVCNKPDDVAQEYGHECHGYQDGDGHADQEGVLVADILAKQKAGAGENEVD